ncbi:MAG: type I-E CRISPR-associated endonuclease Cas1 [Chloroflexi bacterium]|nr:type I-E CRISPR-associated endonuclease Cas1 [Chloroflexota bacterium]
MRNLHELPKIRDSLSYLYVEHCRIEQEDSAIALFDKQGRTPVPCASLTLLMIGPGTSITHAAIRALADCGCMVAWTGEDGIRFYAFGTGETRSAHNLLRQARAWADPAQHMAVVRRMYAMRFAESIDENLTLQQLRGREGLRVRATYEKASHQTGLPWFGRAYERTEWGASDPINRALSAANSCLYGVCHSAILSAGYSAALGFIHTGKILSFVYDVADLYKAEISIPIAFQSAAEGETGVERRARLLCRDAFRSKHLLQRIIPDIDLAVGTGTGSQAEIDFDLDGAAPGGLWDDETQEVAGGVNRFEDAGQEP